MQDLLPQQSFSRCSQFIRYPPLRLCLDILFTVNMKLCLTIFLLNIIFLTSVYYYAVLETGAEPKGPTISRNTITPLENKKIFVISAYYDGRWSRSVRVLTITHGKDIKELYCWFYCKNYPEFVSVRATIDYHQQWFGFHYGPSDVVCPEPPNCSSPYISIHWSNTTNTSHVPVFEIKNRNPQPFSSNFTVCVSTMFGNQENVLQFVQSLEMYRLLGAQKVVIYKTSCSKAIGQMLDYYVSEGFVEIVPWPIDKYLITSDIWHQSMDSKSQIGYYGQLLALNDCLYRNMYKSRYVILCDLDEIILPRLHKTWDELMEALEKEHPNMAAYQIENRLFRNNITVPNFQTVFPKNVQGTNILQVIYYEPGSLIHTNFKMIVNPREVIQTSVHDLLKAYKSTVNVASHIVGLYHVRRAYQINLPRESLKRDTTIWKYNSSLITNVNKVLKQLHYH